MEFSHWRGHRLSRLMLGTAQFGMTYGVANLAGQPSAAEVARMIATAVDGGVNCLDTAAAYGTSEDVIGAALRELTLRDRIFVVTKVRPVPEEAALDRAAAAKHIEQSVEQSRRRLGLDCLPGVLFHREQDAAFLDVLLAFRDRGWIEHVGVSCDNQPGKASTLAADHAVSILQIPGSVIDCRHVAAGSFQAAAQQDVAVFVRSVFLQGLLLMETQSIPAPLQRVLNAREKLNRLARASGMELPELAVRFLLSFPEVTSLVIGVESDAQILRNLELIRSGPLTPDILQAVQSLELDLTDEILSPKHWVTSR